MGRRAFVSTTTFSPTGGIEGADAVCAQDAMMAGLSGTFQALLATDMASAVSRFAPGLPWVRTDGILLATTGADFDPTAMPPAARGITCYFCHNVKAVTATHNNGLVLAHDQTMRGGVKDPISSPAHRSRFDPLMDSDTNQSEICGSCHDVVTPRGVELERTYQEWLTTIFALPDARFHLSCGGCHMRSSSGRSIRSCPPVTSAAGHRPHRYRSRYRWGRRSRSR